MIGQSVSHYRILEELGGGGMGAVYKAEDTKLKRTVALKFLSPEFTRDKDAKTRFIHEAQAASSLQHNNICAIHEIDETKDGRLFIAMDYYEGGALKEVIAKGPLSGANALDIAIQIADGLAEAHSRGIIHRDIKPANIMVTEKGVVKIVDFGIAKLAGQTRVTKTGTTVGTVSYMSPEQAKGEEVDHRSDIWSLGVVLYELLAGELPFVGQHEAALLYQIVHEKPKPLESIVPKVPKAISQIVNRALSKDREDRYSSAEDLLNDLKTIQRSLQSAEKRERETVSLFRILRRPSFAVPSVMLALTLGSLLLWWVNRHAKVRWAREVALPEIARLVDDVPWTGEGLQTWTAFELATEATQYIPDDPLLTRLWPRFSWHVGIQTDPSGAKAYARPYSDIESEWRYLGQTPIDCIRYPSGYSRLKLEKEGYRTIYDLTGYVTWLSDTVTLHYSLPETGRLPEEMEQVHCTMQKLRLPGLENLEARKMGDFLIDRYEVTNKAYKQFVDSGGYTNPEYWKYPFVKDGRTLAWEEALALFTDRTGRPGPATWEIGDYPEGAGDYPVSGVSWYEAAAFAEFAGKNLPTVFHWELVAWPGASSEIIPLSNLPGDGPVPVGRSHSMNRFGVYDMAGNVREWCFNKSSVREERFILGGGWNDPQYAFPCAFAQYPFDRSETNGFRCIRYLEPGEDRAGLEETIELPSRDFLTEPKVSDATFATFLKQYAYDKTGLDAVVEYVDEEEDWVREKVTFNAAYGNERMDAYLFLPKRGKPPYQTVIYFPGYTALIFESSIDRAIPFIVTLGPGSRDFLQKSGRAVIYPVYKSTYERSDDLKTDTPDETHFYKEHVIMWVKDLCRSIDYLETRDDIDTDKLAYFGYSWGSTLGGIMAAVEGRVKTSILLVGGFNFQRSLPEVDLIHYLPRVKTPVLMLNGEYDFFYPHETSQVPFFDLIGTEEKDKKLFLTKTSHIVPTYDLINETLTWLDRYLGPVEKSAAD